MSYHDQTHDLGLNRKLAAYRAGITEAIVLVGGRGTRLGGLTRDLPKPMMPIGDRPFLEFVLSPLVEFGVSHICLAVGYRADVIQQHFGNDWLGCQISYSTEDSPLGTGGAIVRALGCVAGDSVVVANGDTLFRVSYSSLCMCHSENDADVTIAVRRLKATGRFGIVVLGEGSRVVEFQEKAVGGSTFINGGVYVVKRQTILDNAPRSAFSFEREFLECEVSRLNIKGFLSDAYFIDMGVPADLERARRELAPPRV